MLVGEGQDKALRQAIFEEMSGRTAKMNDQEAALFLKELTVVALTGFEVVAGPKVALGLLTGLVRYVLTDADLQAEAEAMGQLKAGATVQ